MFGIFKRRKPAGGLVPSRGYQPKPPDCPGCADALARIFRAGQVEECGVCGCRIYGPPLHSYHRGPIPPATGTEVLRDPDGNPYPGISYAEACRMTLPEPTRPCPFVVEYVEMRDGEPVRVRVPLSEWPEWTTPAKPVRSVP